MHAGRSTVGNALTQFSWLLYKLTQADLLDHDIRKRAKEVTWEASQLLRLEGIACLRKVPQYTGSCERVPLPLMYTTQIGANSQPRKRKAPLR